MRLDKYLVEASLGTRKVTREFIKNKKVRVNGELVIDPSTIIDEKNDKIYFDEKLISNLEKVYYMFNKPSGCVTARIDNEKSTIMEYFKDIDNRSIFPVGRLDLDTEGLLFLTNDGDFNNSLMHPKYHVKKKYFFWAVGEIKKENIELLEKGVEISKNGKLTKPSNIEIIKQGEYKTYKDEISTFTIEKRKMRINNHNVVAGHLTISEGQKHQVKKMLKAVGLIVIYLKRVSIADIELDANLKNGDYRELSKEEVDKLMNLQINDTKKST